MNHKLLIRTLELLEETFPECYHAERLIKKLGAYSFNGEFFKVIKYLKGKGKIIVRYNIQDNNNRETLQQGDEISITPDGIDFLIEAKSIGVNEKRNNLIMRATIIITLATVINIIITTFIYFIKSK